MPPKTNLSKLRKRSEENSEPASASSTRKQVTISKFFTSKSKSKTPDDKGSSGIENSVNHKAETKGSNNGEKPTSLVCSRKRDMSPQNSLSPETTPKPKKPKRDSNTDTGSDHEAVSTSPAEKKTTSQALSQQTLVKLSSFSMDSDDVSSEKDTDIKPGDLFSLHQKNKRLAELSSTADSGIHKNESSKISKQNTNCSSKQKQKLLTFANSKKGTALPATVPSNAQVKYTPLEQQYMEIKEQYPGAILFVECGYKYRFFGNDAEVAAKELNIFCHMDHNFMTASIPTHRLFVHVRRLVSKGHKVGVVKQTETAALKAAGDNKSAPFTRQMSALYTKATLIGEDVDPLTPSEPGDGEGVSSSDTGAFLMCVYDEVDDNSRSQNQSVGIVAIQPSTGDIIYDYFEDKTTRTELETRIAHIQPAEILLPSNHTEATQKLIHHIAGISSTDDDRMRVEQLSDDLFNQSEARQKLTEYYGESEAEEDSRLVDILKLPTSMITCLSALIAYLKDFQLDQVLKLTGNMKQFSTKLCHMTLNAAALQNLEILCNSFDKKVHGSLLWALDHTVTKFGHRLLKQWITKPLLSTDEINKRLDALTEIIQSDVIVLTKMKDILTKLPDIERGLCSVYHQKCSTVEFLSLCKALHSVYTEMKVREDTARSQLQSSMLTEIFTQVPDQLEDINKFVSSINEKAAREGDKTRLFTDESQFPTIVKRKKQITDVLQEIKDHRREVRLTLRLPSLDYVTVLGTEFLIEVKNTQLKMVPSNWVKISSTKTVSRFHSPFIVEAYKRLNQLREMLTIDCNEAWQIFLKSFSEKYQSYRQAVKHLATLDCLYSLATVAKQNGYCRPVVSAYGSMIKVEGGRHPVVDLLLSESGQYVPNDTHLQANGHRCMIITGPNMGGKSSYIKQVALLVVMAQIGSYVPAASARLGVFDGIYTRMGASDEIYKGRSTFMVELQEAAEVMAEVTPRSLVILDELGRGTSTHDGVAIAYATLRHFVEKVKCITLFVTHYPPLAELEKVHSDVINNYHMAFLLNESTVEEEKEDASDVITFLYTLTEGVASRSYGLNVARLADIPSTIVAVAESKSRELERNILKRRSQKDMFIQLFDTEKDRVRDVLGKISDTATSSLPT